MTTSVGLAAELSKLRCVHDRSYKHAEISGSETSRTAAYPPKLCETFLHSLFPFIHDKRVPLNLICKVAQDFHRVEEVPIINFGASPVNNPIGVVFDDISQYIDTSDLTEQVEEVLACVTKLLKRSEYTQEAHDSIKKEGEALVEAGTWLESTVIEKDALIRKARRDGIKVHLGDLLTLCSIKFFEKERKFWKWKGRICFRGDNVRDEDGALAVFQEMSSVSDGST